MSDHDGLDEVITMRGMRIVDPISVGSPDPWLWVGDRGQGTVVRRSPGNTGWRRGLFDGEGGLRGEDLTLESYLSKNVEGPAARALRDWVDRPQGSRSPIPPELFRYLAWAASRGLPMLQLYEDWLNALPAVITYVEPPPAGFENIPWSRQRYRLEHPVHGVRDGVPLDESHAMRSEGWRIRLQQEDFLQAAHFQAWYFQVRWFPRLRWTILDAPPGHFFIVADRPVVWGFAELQHDGISLLLDVPPSALRDSRVQLFAPLTRSIALFAFHESGPPPKLVRPDHVNRIVASGAHDWIAGPTRATIEAVLSDVSTP